MFRKTVVNWKHGDANAAAVPTSHIHTVLTSHIVNILSKKFWNKEIGLTLQQQANLQISNLGSDQHRIQPQSPREVTRQLK